MEIFTKYVCDAMIALTASMLINYLLVVLSSRLRHTSDSELLKHTLNYYENSDPESRFAGAVENHGNNWFLKVLTTLHSINPFLK